MTPPPAAGAGTLRRPIAPRAPRRVSGPARPSSRGAGPAARPATADALGPRAARRARGLADSRFLDRLVRGRLWIPVVAIGLMGIVFMQVTMLKLNAGIGRAVESTATLERVNAGYRADVSRLEAGDRVEQVATRLGMVAAAAGSTRYDTAHAGDAALATRHMTAPSSAAVATTTAATTAAAAATSAATTAGSAPSAATTTGAAAPTVAATPPATTVTPPATDAAATATPSAATAPASTAPAATTQPVSTASPGATAAPTTSQQAAVTQQAAASAQPTVLAGATTAPR